MNDVGADQPDADRLTDRDVDFVGDVLVRWVNRVHLTEIKDSAPQARYFCPWTEKDGTNDGGNPCGCLDRQE
jgi:hypothetical protein